jgi:hypothetical protein
MTGREWLEWFLAQPQTCCAKCSVMNETNPAPWWRGNCTHFRHLERRP